MVILGLNAFHPHAAAAISIDGRIVAAVEEERLTRVKHAGGFPASAIRACLEIAGLTIADVRHVAVARRPEANMRGPILYALSGRPSYSWELRAALEEAAEPVDWRAHVARATGVPAERLSFEVRPVEHAIAHAAGAFFPSEHDEAAVLVGGTVGDYCSTLLARGQGAEIRVLERVLFPHSLGLFYGMLSQLLGFGVAGDESRTMGLAAFGGDRLLETVRGIVRPAKDAAFELDLDWFRHAEDGEPVRPVEGVPRNEPLYSALAVLRLGRPRHHDEPIGERERDLAFAAQRVLEERLVDTAARLKRLAGCEDLVYGGLLAMNCNANRAVRQSGLFRSVATAAAPVDSGAAVGAALALSAALGEPRVRTPLASRRTDLGPAFDPARVRAALEARGLPFEEPADVTGETAAALARGEVVAWFDGRMEFGPRALGHRSVLADPRCASVGDRLRRTLSRREPFRSYGASVPLEDAPRFFEDVTASPFLLDAFRVRKEAAATIPAVVHHDGTTRVHTVVPEAHPRFHALLRAFGAATGVPVLLDTSLNADEPIVCTPEEAVACALRSRLDRIVIDGLVARLRQEAPGRPPGGTPSAPRAAVAAAE